ncbi:DUF3306 domain-containing protein [Variovorax paradoxus]|uniref:DUF3306 domain-containing protein n=1 Tax=Variovorax paradoxus TaxID=34073 RepID=A0A0H2LZF6_VARPD|nr:DUF3306 domain-containing protein [Variovorax paradoxus]KLN53842.1 hypothetical protein VPARA_49700 [Variovorax paradoxus]
MSENFFDRWSRRKKEAREDVSSPPTVQEVEEPLPAPSLPAEGQGEIPPPTLAEAQALTPESDFRPFMARNVAPEVKNTAFRKLFADPQFNVMDGLDTYVDDYSQSTPIPDSVLRQMASAKFLRLFEHEEEAEVPQEPAAPAETPQGAAPPDVAQSEPPEDLLPSQQVADAQPASQKTDDHNADLRLQPDDAARAEGARRGAG